jgi:hypothetical protein
MHVMGSNCRLALCGIIIVGSALYSVLVVEDPRLAETLAIGYIAILLTVFTVVNIWKKP